MNYKKFCEVRKEQLNKYKEKYITTESGYYRGRKYKHILPANIKMKNLFAEETQKNVERYGIELHTYFSHLNSSQAMCINFFDKLIQDDEGKELLLQVIKQIITTKVEDGVKIDKCVFEKTITKEDGDYNLDEGTNFDFYIKLTNGIQIFWEIKYTENGFGKTKAEVKPKRGFDTHEEKFNKVYNPELKDTINLKHLENRCDEFLSNYQIYRNIFYVRDENKDFMIFLIPVEN